jgi:hypothetical protein
MSTIKNKSTVVDHAKQLVAGTAKHLGNATQVRFTGGSYTPADITSKLQLIVSLREGVDAAKATTKARLAAEKADMPALHTFMGALVTFVKATYGDMPEVLADFGIHPKTRASPTVHTKAVATAKRAATRVARTSARWSGRGRAHPTKLLTMFDRALPAFHPLATDEARSGRPLVRLLSM